MIKVSELRLGNIISHNGEPVPVYQIERRFKTRYRLNDLDVDERTIEDHFQPIPLTPEWLSRCKFKETFIIGRYADTESYIIDLNQGQDLSGISVEIKHLHQLQNLYHSLTGEELSITL